MKFWKRCVNRLWVNKFPLKILDFGWHHALVADVTGFKLHMHVVLKLCKFVKLCQLFLSMCFSELKVNYTACLIKKTKSFYFIEANSLCRLLKETSNTFSVFSFYRKRCVDRWCRELERNELQTQSYFNQLVYGELTGICVGYEF